MRLSILVGCEESGTVRDALIALGHDAISCDILPSARPGPHIQHNVIDIAYAPPHRYRWDAMIVFPPCTDLACSGAAWFERKIADGSQGSSIKFFLDLANAPIEKIGIENPIGIMSSQYRKPDQIIQPHMFGHPEFKATCLWLKGLSKLMPTDQLVVPIGVDRKNWEKVWRMGPGPDRAKMRSRTYQGIADAMASQWFGAA